MKNQQRGGTILGLIFGMVIGLAAALAVAIYVTKVPNPFVSTGGNNTERDAAEAERNKNWDPNAPLQSRQPAPAPATTPAPSDVTVATPTTPAQPTASGGVTTPTTPATTPVTPTTTPATPTAGADKPTKPASGDPLGDLVKERSAAADKAEKARAEKEKATQTAQAGDAAFNYFVQAGAFRGQSEAEAQRAKLAMLGWESRISEREQNGITVFRVRVGPFSKRDDADQLKGKLDGAGVASTLVRAAK